MRYITIVLGTARTGRASQRVADALENALRDNSEIEVTLIDVRDHVTTTATTPPWGKGGADEQPTEWKKIATTTDAFICILPEYNHGYPGEWKLLMDSLFDEYKGKQAYVVTVSAGSFAGVRLFEHVQPVLHELGLTLSQSALHIGNVTDTINEDGTVTDEKTKERLDTFIAAVSADGI